MSDKEADKFNNINLSSDSDQGINRSSVEEPSNIASCDIKSQESSSRKVPSRKVPSRKVPSRRSSRNRKSVIDCNIQNTIAPIKKKSKVKKRCHYQHPPTTFIRANEGIQDSSFKGPCYCKSQTTKCIKLTEEDRRAIYDHVRNLPIDWRYGYVTELVRRLPIKGKYSMKEPMRKRSWVIYFHLTKICGTILPVCKLMFINTTGLTANFIRKSLVKKEIENSQSLISESLPCNYDSKQPVKRKETLDQYKETPALFCRFDDQNNPIVVTTWEPNHNTLKSNSSQPKYIDNLSISDHHHPDETFEDHNQSSLPAVSPQDKDCISHSVISPKSSPLGSPSINNVKCANKTLQSKSMNHREGKRIFNGEAWVPPRHNKTPRDLGQSYVSKGGKLVPARQLQDRCWCRSITTRCIEITEDDRKAVFEHVWSLAKDEKKDFISEFVERAPVKRKRTPTSKKDWTFQFNLRRVTGDVIPVCKKMFMKTTSLTSFLIRTVVARKDSNAATMIEPESLFYSKYSYDNQSISMDEDPEPCKDSPSLVCQFDEQNNPIVVTAWQSTPKHPSKDSFKSRLSDYPTLDEMPASENDDIGEFSMPDNCSDSVSDTCMNTSSTLSLDPDSNPNDEEEKQKLIEQVLERQNTLDDLSSRVDSVKVENLKLKSENQVLGQYIENLMAASSVFQSASPKAKKK